MAMVSSLPRRQLAKALLGAAAVAVASWLYFANVWRGVVLSGAGDAQAVRLFLFVANLHGRMTNASDCQPAPSRI